MNRYIMDRLMRDSRGRLHRNNGEYARDRRDRYSDRTYDRYDGRGDSRGYDRYDRRRGRSDRNYGGDSDYESYDDYGGRDFEYNSRLELSERDLREWEQSLKKDVKFSDEQILKAAEHIGVKFDKFSEQEFMITAEMLYSDFSEALRKANVPERPELYAYLAKAWLCDEDFQGEPYEKLALYYYAIVDFEE